MKKLKHIILSLDPVWFTKHSFSYMRGHSKFYILGNLPKAYYRYCKSFFASI